MDKLNKEEKIEKKNKSAQEKKEFYALAKQYYGKPFSTNGICTARRYWITSAIIFLLKLLVVLPNIFILYYVDCGIDSIQLHLHPVLYRYVIIFINALKTEHFIFIAISFWLAIFGILVILYRIFLKVKRFKSVDLNPWLVCIPIFSSIVSFFIPCKVNFQDNKYFKNKIKFNALFISVLVIISLLFLSYCIYAIYMDLVYNDIINDFAKELTKIL